MRKKMPIFYSALMLTGVNLLLRFVSTLFQVYVSGRIGAAGVGLLQLVLSVGMLAMTAGMAGVRTATMYLTAEELGVKRPENVIWVLSACFIYSIVCSGTVALGLYRFAPFLAATWIGDPRTVGAIRLIAAFLPIQCLCGCMTGYFTAANRIRTLAAVEVAEQLCSMSVTVIMLTVWAGSDPARACQAVVFGSGVGACITLISLILLRLREHIKPGPHISFRSRLLHIAVPLALADDLKSGISTGENLMVPKRLGLYAGTENALAAFGTVCGMVFPILMFPAAILFGLAELLIPELARCVAAGSHRRIQYLVRRSLRVALFYGCLFSGLMFLAADKLCTILYDSQDAGRYLRMYALLIPIVYCDAITDAMTKGLGQQKACVRYNILTSGMDVACLYFLLPRYGMNGYYFSFLITHLLNFALSLRRLLKIAGIRISIYIPAFSAAAAIASVWAASHLSQPILQCVAYPLLLGSQLVLYRIWGKEDLHWIKGLFQL
ncbi:MAG: polysaccharide biosynthesis C-terminal domain-containing protein [Oscillospiraceae bacterium]|nr:polysaccharide biosynthesis C-terminal domain-containing protein [Oscillospiraceae bacterium]